MRSLTSFWPDFDEIRESARADLDPTCEPMRDALEGRDHLRRFLDTHSAAELNLRDRQLSSDPYWQTFLLAIAEHEIGQSLGVLPLPQEWIIGAFAPSKDRILRSAPEWLREKNILLREKDLITA